MVLNLKLQFDLCRCFKHARVLIIPNCKTEFYVLQWQQFFNIRTGTNLKRANVLKYIKACTISLSGIWNEPYFQYLWFRILLLEKWKQTFRTLTERHSLRLGPSNSEVSFVFKFNKRVILKLKVALHEGNLAQLCTIISTT